MVTQVLDTKATLQLPDQSIDLPIIVGTENEHAVDITKLRGETGYITGDPAYGNTGATLSNITYIDGEKGILRYRGYAIEDLAEHATFMETAWLLIYGELPTQAQLETFNSRLVENERLVDDLKIGYRAFPKGSHPMAVLASMIHTCSTHHPEVLTVDDHAFSFDTAAAMLLAKVPGIAAWSYSADNELPMMQPKRELRYVSNFLHMMFSTEDQPYEMDDDVVSALRLFLILHADHEQNCSTSTVRMVGSSGANLFASCSAGVSALWGPLHGGANQAVIEMLTYIEQNNIKLTEYMEKVKKKEVKLMGFGHRVYKNFDPRAKILKEAAHKVLPKLVGANTPMFDLAQELEDLALNDDYFKERNLYPNVDFYSGLILRAMGIPVNMFTVMFALGRMPGWIAHWKEVHDDPKGRISRPRQVYTGAAERKLIPIGERK